MGEMATLDSSGDTKCIWDPNNPDEVAAARKQFEELTSKGFLAFKVQGKDHSKGEQIKKFDPSLERIILAPPMRGG